MCGKTEKVSLTQDFYQENWINKKIIFHVTTFEFLKIFFAYKYFKEISFCTNGNLARVLVTGSRRRLWNLYVFPWPDFTFFLETWVSVAYWFVVFTSILDTFVRLLWLVFWLASHLNLFMNISWFCSHNYCHNWILYELSSPVYSTLNAFHLRFMLTVLKIKYLVKQFFIAGITTFD